MYSSGPSPLVISPNLSPHLTARGTLYEYRIGIAVDGPLLTRPYTSRVREAPGSSHKPRLPRSCDVGWSCSLPRDPYYLVAGTSTLGVARNRNSSCGSAIVFVLGLLFNPVSLPQNELRRSSNSPPFGCVLDRRLVNLNALALEKKYLTYLSLGLCAHPG